MTTKKETVPDTVQGEGNYEAARRYDKSASDFVRSGKIATAARKAKPLDADEAAKLSEAEPVGLSRSKGEDSMATPAPNDNRAAVKSTVPNRKSP